MLSKLLRRVFKLHDVNTYMNPGRVLEQRVEGPQGKHQRFQIDALTSSCGICVCVCVCVCTYIYMLKISLGELQEATLGSSLDCYCIEVHTVGEGRGTQGNTQF